MQKNIYIPDALGVELSKYPINISAVCQYALRKEIDIMKTVEQSERVIVNTDEGKKAFQGTLIHRGDEHDYYLSQKRNIVVVDEDTYYVFDDFDDFANAYANDPDAVRAVADELGEDYIEELDI